MPERTLLWSDGLSTFEECTDPRHLLYDTLILGHCAGTLFNRSELAHYRLTPDRPDAIRYLHYWLKIKNERRGTGDPGQRDRCIPRAQTARCTETEISLSVPINPSSD
jgi:hypothetical protein